MNVSILRLLGAFVIFSFLSLSPDAALAQKKKGGKKGKKNPPTTSQPTPPKKKTLEDLVKKHEKFEGLFTFYRDSTDGSTKVLIKKEQLDKEFIYFTYVENGSTSAGRFRGSYRGSRIFRINKYYKSLEFIYENTNYYYDKDNALSRASDANISKAIFASEKIMFEDDSTGNILINADNLFLREVFSQVKPTYFPGSRGFKLGRLDRSKTKVLKLKSYPKNSDVVVEYVYSNPYPTYGGAGITDARNVTVTIQHSLIEVPKEEGFEVRYEDPRVGFFTTQVTDMTSTEATPYRDMIHHWRLEKKYPDAAMSEPVEPITYWIENTTPVELRDIIKKAALKWNRAFEKAGFKNAFVVKVQPDDADWDAGDIRYNVLRWTSSPNPPFNGYGPSFVNPRTGEILGADIMLEFGAMTRRVNEEKLIGAVKKDAEAIEHLGEHEMDVNDPEFHQKLCSAGEHAHHNMLLGSYYNDILGSKIPNDEYIEGAIHYLILHEIGHTLGLMHNMKASQLHSPEDLQNKELTQKEGLVGSVMDYPCVNISLDPAKQGEYFFSRVGPYDVWAIQYGYTPALADEKEDAKRIADLLNRSNEKGLTFGNDADDMRSPGKGIDPRVNVRELSNDAVRYSVDRIKLVNKLTKGLLAKYSTTEGNSYQELRNAYGILRYERYMATSAITRYIGGVYVDRSMQGQTGATKPFTPVPYEYQKGAMKALAEYVFAPNAYDTPEELYRHLQIQRRGYNFFSSTEDPKIHSGVLLFQSAALAHILHPTTLQRITDTELYGNKYTLVEFMTELNAAIFDADIKGDVNTFRQNLQVYYTNMLISMIGKNKAYYSHQARAMALFNLKAIAKSVEKAEGNTLSVAHKMNLSLMIEKALEEAAE